MQQSKFTETLTVLILTLKKVLLTCQSIKFGCAIVLVYGLLQVEGQV